MRARRLGLALGLLVVLAAAAGCLLGPDVPDGDDPREDPETPDTGDDGRSAPGSGPAPTPVPVTGLSPLAHLDAEGGLGVDARGSLAVVAAPSGLYTVDLSDPGTPATLGVAHDAGSRYVEIVEYPGRLVAVASGANQDLLHFVDVTDPRAPEVLTSFDPDRTVHNVARVPGTYLLYNPRGVGDPVEPGIDLIDASDPTSPEVVDRWPFPETSGVQPTRTTGCAVVTFDLEQDRAFCPAVSQTYVLDVENRTQPEVVAAITNPAINVHHWTATVDGGSTLLIADWASAANAPSCGRAGPLEGTSGPPAGAVWSYDLSDPANPAPQGWVTVSPPEGLGPDEPCSPHVLDKIPGQPLVLAAWHHGGVALLDVSDPSQPAVLDRWTGGGNSWAVTAHGNLALAGDRSGGLDVLELTG